ncbi:hypothetical protein K438DRAFT_1875542 [Mycena galopus ATCC 62051]|nr:hypothetical protein K438DRAFT_1875542 [Mycena galopus ATCC 62051]
MTVSTSFRAQNGTSPHVSDDSHPHGSLPSVQAQRASSSSSTRRTSHSSAHGSTPHPSPPRKKRSRRCFVCGGTGKHRLHPRFCPRTTELFAKRLVMFDFAFRLVSFDGSPLPMTRHPGGVAAHLLSPRGSSSRPARALPRSPSTSPRGSKLNPPHFGAAAAIRPRTIEPIVDSNPLHAPHAMPISVRSRVSHAVPIADLDPSHAPHPLEPRHVCSEIPIADLNPSHAPRPLEPHCVLDTVLVADLNPSHTPPAAIEHLRRVSVPDCTFESNPPHVPRAPHATPAPVPRRVSDAVPIEDSNPAHASLSSVVSPQPIPVSNHSVESSLSHFPPVERLLSPPIYLPIQIPHPDSKPIVDPPNDDSSPPITLSIFDILFISPPVRNELRKLIDAMDKSNVGYDIPFSPHLRKVFYRILDQITNLLSSR